MSQDQGVAVAGPPREIAEERLQDMQARLTRLMLRMLQALASSSDPESWLSEPEEVLERADVRRRMTRDLRPQIDLAPLYRVARQAVPHAMEGWDADDLPHDCPWTLREVLGGALEHGGHGAVPAGLAACLTRILYAMIRLRLRGEDQFGPEQAELILERADARRRLTQSMRAALELRPLYAVARRGASGLPEYRAEANVPESCPWTLIEVLGE